MCERAIKEGEEEKNLENEFIAAAALRFLDEACKVRHVLYLTSPYQFFFSFFVPHSLLRIEKKAALVVPRSIRNAKIKQPFISPTVTHNFPPAAI